MRGRFFALPGSEQGPGEEEAEGIGQEEEESGAGPGVFGLGLAGVPKQIFDRLTTLIQTRDARAPAHTRTRTNRAQNRTECAHKDM